VAAVKAKNTQSQRSKRATIEQLKNKKPRTREVSVILDKDEGPVSFLLRAIGAKDFDKMLTKFPPTIEQKADGNTFNPDTFAPALMARVVAEPEVPAEEWAAIIADGNWSRGEASDLFYSCMQLCSGGLDLDPTVAD
jgi:hypothetical protein